MRDDSNSIMINDGRWMIYVPMLSGHSGKHSLGKTVGTLGGGTFSNTALGGRRYINIVLIYIYACMHECISVYLPIFSSDHLPVAFIVGLFRRRCRCLLWPHPRRNLSVFVPVQGSSG
jgi:hypothetical protein